MTASFRLDRRRQGPTGAGQGGWTAHRFATSIDHPVAISIRDPIPLDTDLAVVPTEDPACWALVTRARQDTIMTAVARSPLTTTTPSVSVDDGRAARSRFGWSASDHPVPWCFSCGMQPDSMGVQAGPLPGGDRFATDWTVPDWAVSAAGHVDEGALWAALDCTAAWYVCGSDGERVAVTVRYSVDVHAPLVAGGRYALVAWSGDAAARWEGRKRHAASAAFAADGTCVATSESLWVSITE